MLQTVSKSCPGASGQVGPKLPWGLSNCFLMFSSICAIRFDLFSLLFQAFRLAQGIFFAFPACWQAIRQMREQQIRSTPFEEDLPFPV